ncbi:MAG: hypothetical protein NW208_08950 [Bryobacter sp.]|nr:hypothetical protein [Bryobacter sp.]
MRTIVTGLTCCAWLMAAEPKTSLPPLGWHWDETRGALLRIEGLPGSLKGEEAELPPADQRWASATLLVERRGDLYVRHDLLTGESGPVEAPAGSAFVFSTDGRRFHAYPANEAAPFVTNDGTVREQAQFPHRLARESGNRILAIEGQELIALEDRVERQRWALPVAEGVRDFAPAGEQLLLLTNNGDLYQWAPGEAEAILLATSVGAMAPLATPGFFVTQSTAGVHLLYPASAGQKSYLLRSAKEAK